MTLPARLARRYSSGLFDAAEVHDRGPSTHFAVEDVDLHFPKPDRRHDRPVDSRGAARDDDSPREQFLRREGDSHDVVDAEVEYTELGRQVPAPGEAEDRRDGRRQLPGRAESAKQRGAVVVLHVDERKVRLPVGEEGLDLGQAGSGPDREQAVVQRELDQVDHRAAVVQDQRAATFISSV